LRKSNKRFIFKITVWFKFLSLVAHYSRVNFINADLDCVLGDFEWQKC
jgi:hypothetical protein